MDACLLGDIFTDAGVNIKATMDQISRESDADKDVPYFARKIGPHEADGCRMGFEVPA